ncbi:DUF2523 family protein [Stenotrophomonas sp.]|uniref:DUF2523 family protein n=1 Tax=Stenotrophomonas sp. TaxID=69392 RepID=UPI0028B11028|nr:DUF2523 family protein [Stenotrophomonas sp.]
MFEKITSMLVGFSGHLIGGLKLAASAIFARVLAACGLTFVNYQYVLPSVKAWLIEHTSGIPGMVREIAGAMGVDIFMTMIVSALVAKVGMRVFLAGVTQLQGMIADAGG